MVEPTEERIAAAAALIDGESAALVARATLDRLLSELELVENSSFERPEEASWESVADEEDVTDTLLADVESVAGRLSGLRERIEQLTESERTSAASIRQYELQVQTLTEACAAESATIERLERELAEQRQLISNVHVQLAAVVDLLARD